MTQYVSLPKAAKDAADRGDLLLAIKHTQETMGVGLQDAERAVHAYVKGEQRSAEPNPGFAEGGPGGSALPPQAMAALSRGNLIEAIKHTRNANGLGLKEAKDTVEKFLARNPHAKQQFETSVNKASVNLAPVLAVFVLALVAAGTFAAYMFSVKG